MAQREDNPYGGESTTVEEGGEVFGFLRALLGHLQEEHQA